MVHAHSLMHLTLLYPPLTRFDVANNALFSGGPGDLFKHRTLDLHPELEVKIVKYEDNALPPVIPDSRYLALGDAWMKRLGFNEPLNKLRGYRLTFQNLPLICTYAPIDCWEFKDSSEDDDDESDGKDVAVTKRTNYLFWAINDLNKLLRPIRPLPECTATVNLDPILAAKWLDGLPSGYKLILDIETRISDHVLDCIGLGTVRSDGSVNVFNVAIYNGNALAHPLSKISRFWRSLYTTLRRKDITVVGHNLAFDLSILHHYYHFPIPYHVFDTMLVMHRMFPYVDKSLSHAISYFTDAAYNHKGDLVVNQGGASLIKLLTYNNQDLHLTAAVAMAQLRIIDKDPALQDSVSIAHDMQRLAFIMSFTGVLVDKTALQKQKDKLNVKLSALLRIIRCLADDIALNPNSTQQVANYFYNKLQYPIPAYTESGAPKLDEKTFYKLQLQQPNPLIPLIIEYKMLNKELSMLNFIPLTRSMHNV